MINESVTRFRFETIDVVATKKALGKMKNSSGFNVFLNLPEFLCSKTQFTQEEVVFSRKISSCRIHVERAIERLRNYKILDFLNAPLRPFGDKIVQVFAVFVKLQIPIIAGIFQDYNDVIASQAS